MVATILGIIDCALLVAAGEKIRVDLLGIFLAICAGGSYAIFTTAGKGLLEEHASEAVMAGISMILVGLVIPSTEKLRANPAAI